MILMPNHTGLNTHTKTTSLRSKAFAICTLSVWLEVFIFNAEKIKKKKRSKNILERFCMKFFLIKKLQIGMENVIVMVFGKRDDKENKKIKNINGGPKIKTFENILKLGKILKLLRNSL